MTADRHTSRSVSRAVASAAVLAAVLIVVPIVLLTIDAVPHSAPSLHPLLTSLGSRDDTGAYFRVAGGFAVWAAWVVFVAATVKETVASIRFRGPRPSAPLHGLRRLGPAGLVATIAILFVAAPAGLALSPTQASAGPAPSASSTLDVSPRVGSTANLYPATVRTAATTASAELPTYVVHRYDTLWSIAERHLPGDPARRYKDIRTLNPGLVGDDNTIVAGTTLTLPADAYGLPNAPAAAAVASVDRMVTVHVGDSLSGIAENNGVADWYDVWADNRDRTEPNGTRFTDPDHIEPGWIIDVRIPVDRPTGAATTSPPATATPGSADPPAVAPVAPPTVTTPPAPTAAPSSPAAPSGPSATAQTASATPPSRSGAAPTSTEAAPAQPGAHQVAAEYERVFAGAGAILAAGLLGVLVAYRRRQHRFRRPGRTIPAAPSESVAAERALLAAASHDFGGVDVLDRALRSLAATVTRDPKGALPNVITAQLDEEGLVLHLVCPHPPGPPSPWAADDTGLRWSIDVAEPILVATASNTALIAAPYPALVTVGHDGQGRIWLLDLQAAGVLTVTGDRDRCLNFGRFLAAELAVNSWSAQVDVATVGLGTDVAELNPDRVHTVEQLDGAVDVANRALVAALPAVVSNGALHETTPHQRLHLLLSATPERPVNADALETLRSLLGGAIDRRGPVALVVLDAPESELMAVTLTSDGRLLIPDLELDLIAPQLPVEQVAPIARLLEQAAELRDEAMPASSGEAAYEQFCDAAGAVRPDLTLPREDQEPPYPAELEVNLGDAVGENHAAPKSSLLGLRDDVYLAHAATTTTDLRLLAPRIPSEVQSKVRDADPGLDEDVAAWHDPDCGLPRLTLLGPVQLRANGDRTADVQRRTAYYTELAAYLSTRDHGATAEQIAATFDIATSTVYSRLAVLKGWLGTNPRTGDKHLPDATKSPAGRARGIGLYQLEGVLVDADLFKRLRLRGQSRGADGMADLTAALTLVSGQPFDQLRGGGYEWLTEGNRLDHVYVAAIVDVAHIVATHGLAAGDLTLARTSTETALLAAPYEEIPRLDLVAIRYGEGHRDDANAYLRSEVCNRSDDGDAPLDLPARTREILTNRVWLTKER
jgi:hypothetical protein